MKAPVTKEEKETKEVKVVVNPENTKKEKV